MCQGENRAEEQEGKYWAGGTPVYSGIPSDHLKRVAAGRQLQESEPAEALPALAQCVCRTARTEIGLKVNEPRRE